MISLTKVGAEGSNPGALAMCGMRTRSCGSTLSGGSDRAADVGSPGLADFLDDQAAAGVGKPEMDVADGILARADEADEHVARFGMARSGQRLVSGAVARWSGFDIGYANGKGLPRDNRKVRPQAHAVPVGLTHTSTGASCPISHEGWKNDRTIEGGIDRPVRARSGQHDLTDAFLRGGPGESGLRHAGAQQGGGQSGAAQLRQWRLAE